MMNCTNAATNSGRSGTSYSKCYERGLKLSSSLYVMMM